MELFIKKLYIDNVWVLFILYYGFIFIFYSIFREDGISIEKGVMQNPKRVIIQRWDSDAAEKIIEKNGGSMNIGSGYESKYLVVEPFEELADGKKVTIKMKVDSSTAKIYHSVNYKTWNEIDDYSYDDGTAQFQSRKGIFSTKKFF